MLRSYKKKKANFKKTRLNVLSDMKIKEWKSIFSNKRLQEAVQLQIMLGRAQSETSDFPPSLCGTSNIYQRHLIYVKNLCVFQTASAAFWKVSNTFLKVWAASYIWTFFTCKRCLWLISEVSHKIGCKIRSFGWSSGLHCRI